MPDTPQISEIDAITLEVLRNGLQSIAEEIDAKEDSELAKMIKETTEFLGEES